MINTPSPLSALLKSQKLPSLNLCVTTAAARTRSVQMMAIAISIWIVNDRGSVGLNGIETYSLR